MKKLSIIIFALFVSAIAVKAVPAYPWPIKYRQPDGSVITIQVHGDEFYHYTTSNGKVVALDKDGFYRPSRKPVFDKSAINKARLQNYSLRKSDRKSSLTQGKKRFIVLLVEFSDLHFTVPNAQSAFNSMMNEHGYSANNGTGSVYDYYYENSSGKFDPTFDVAGPIRLSKTQADYGGNDTTVTASGSIKDRNVKGAVVEACQIASTQGLVDFSKYDNDGDGAVDNVFCYFAGYSEAEGGPDDSVWPHASWVSVPLNGVTVGRYACSTEYRGSSGNTMAGIGTFCHEFGHVLGLPDFYDSNYEENGTASTVYHFSLMASGSYNNNARTPPYLGTLERWLLGWRDSIPEWTESGVKTVRPVYENVGYTTPTSSEGEYFLYEVRDGTGWDAYIRARSSDPAPQGLIIYHVDRSDNLMEAGKAISLWGRNSVNDYASHPCYYIVGPGNGYTSYRDLMYPGTRNATSFEGIDWANKKTGCKLSNIAYSDGTATLTLSLPDNYNMSGTVKNTKGNPLPGVKVTVIAEDASSVQALKHSRLSVGIRELAEQPGASYSAVTDAHGNYSLEIPLSAGNRFTATYTLQMYNPKTEGFTITGYNFTQDAILYDLTEGDPGTLNKHGNFASSYGFTSGSGSWSATMAVHFTAAELAPYAGYKFTKLNFTIAGGPATQVDAFVDFGTQRVFTKKVGNPQYGTMMTVDMTDSDLRVPEGMDIYFGYAVKEVKTQYFMAADGGADASGSSVLKSGYNTEGGLGWSTLGSNLIIDADLQSVISPFNGLGAKLISNPGKGSAYAVGTVFKLGFDNPTAGSEATSTEWYYDGAAVSGSSVTLSTAGQHIIKAVLHYEDGSTEEIEQTISVQ